MPYEAAMIRLCNAIKWCGWLWWTLALLGTYAAAASPIQVVALRCEHEVQPLGVLTQQPRLSWQMQTDRAEARQTAWQVRVADGAWDSGKVSGDVSVGIPYAGKPLVSGKEYQWQVRVWDERDQPSDWSATARWVMGKLSPTDWQAEWITMPTEAPGIDLDKVELLSACYRTLDGRVERDVTPRLREVLKQKQLPFEIHFNALGGDPAPNTVKELVVRYRSDGKESVSRAADFERLTIPQSAPKAAAPWFWREFSLDGKPTSALVTVHSAAYVELQVNGQKVGQDVLSPVVSDAAKHTFALTYDVKALLQPGVNRIGLWVGEGWADQPVVRAQLDAVVAGKPVVVATNPDWQTRWSGYFRSGGKSWNDFGGERVDANAWIDGWSRVGVAIPAAMQAVRATGPAGAVLPITPPRNRLGQKISAVSITPLADQRYEIDFGTNLTGWLELRLPTIPAGSQVKCYYADRKFPDGKHVMAGHEVSVARQSCVEFRRTDGGADLYQCYNQVSSWISAGKPAVFRNQFNYAGFQYVVVEGLPKAPSLQDANAWLVETAMDAIGTFECSDPLLNRIHQINQWTLRCLNLGGYMVDCPTRERMGYGGDGQTSLPGMLMGFDSAKFYEKWAADWRAAQAPNGALPNVAPWAIGGGGPPWGGISAALPWNHYLHVGDAAILRDNFAMAKRYVESLDARATGEVIRAWGSGFEFLGDWVPPGRSMDTGNWPTKDMAELVNNCYRIYLWELVGKMARALGNAQEAAHAEQRMAAIRPAVHAAFYDPTHQRYVIDEQLYYLLPLRTGVTPPAEREAVMRRLVTCITEKNRGHLDTGLIGTIFLLDLLDTAGRDDLLLEIYRKKDHPGWGYMVEQGATTVWEQWNGHWSQIHGCFVSADNWLYYGLGGLRPDPAGPGFKKFIVAPPRLDEPFWAKVSHRSPYGTIRVHWQRKANQMLLNLIVPPNTSATVQWPGLPAGQQVVQPGTHQLILPL